MALFDSPGHSIDLYSSTSANVGGGVKITYSTDPVQTAVPCSINTASANTQERYAQQQIVVTHTIGIASNLLGSKPQPGWKAVAGDTGETLMIRGIRSGRAMGSIPAFTYLDVESVL